MQRQREKEELNIKCRVLPGSFRRRYCRKSIKSKSPSRTIRKANPLMQIYFVAAPIYDGGNKTKLRLVQITNVELFAL